MKDYRIKYLVENYGGTISLLNVLPESDYIEDCFFEGKVLQQVYLNDNGVFEIRVAHIFEEDYDHFGIISLEKLYGSPE